MLQILGKAHQNVVLFATAFIVMLSYSLARPATESLFLLHYAQDWLMSVWLLTAFCAAVLIGLYNRFVASHPLLLVFSVSSALCAVVLLGLLGLVGLGYKAASFALYVWKDLYIVLLVEIFWSYASFVFDAQRAKKFFGLFVLFGTLGSLAGNGIVGWVAQPLGTLWVLFLVAPVLFFIALMLALIRPVMPCDLHKTPKSGAGGFLQGLLIVKNSKYLMHLLVLVALVQVCVTLIDYQFHGYLQQHFPDVDTRTKVVGQLYAAVDLVGFALQLISSWLLRTIGVFGVMYTIPSLLVAFVMSGALMPSASWMFVVKGFSKVSDYSLFRPAKEILFIPLNRKERTQGKAVIDVFTYRASKGLSALGLMAVVSLGASAMIDALVLALCVLWLCLIVMIRRRAHGVESGAKQNELRQIQAQ